MTPEQEELWARVESLWAMSQRRIPDEIRAALHPQYCGWDMSMPAPHDCDFAVAAVTGDTPRVTEYKLTPQNVHIYDGSVGVVHYSYAATVESKLGRPNAVTGKWTEIYLKQQDQWIMIAVSGRPDPHADKKPPVGRDLYA